MSSENDSIERDQESRPEVTALPSQLNWLKMLEGKPARSIYEYPLHSDSRITGEIGKGSGPYSFVNAVPIPEGPGIVKSPIVLRIELFLDDYSHDFSKTNDSLYHGGWLEDEIAALTSLCLGVRIAAGGQTRKYEPADDRFGRPIAHMDKPAPVIQLRPNFLVLPSAVGPRSMDLLERIESIPKLEPNNCVALIRASRLYQDALWVAESEPNLSWLMFVSALETAATGFSSYSSSTEEAFRHAEPELVKIMETYSTQMISEVAELFAHKLKATKKFIDFTLKFMPEEPPKRPAEEAYRVDWSTTALKKILNSVYRYRSQALHSGIPFPAPMLCSPMEMNDNSPLPEVGTIGLAQGGNGGIWLAKDVPINLNCFHHIVRGVLLNWWDEIAKTEKTSGECE